MSVWAPDVSNVSVTAMVPRREAVEKEPSEPEAEPGLLDATRPRDLLEGLGSGLTCAGAGFAAGGAALVAMPAVGLSEARMGHGGGPGCALGLAVGGSAAGCAQLVRGVLNTPEAATEIQTHSQVLILASPVFKKMLTHEMIEKKSHRIELPGKCPNEFKALLRFLQPGTARQQKISGQNVEFLVRWCDEYCIDSLKNECIQFIKKQKPSINRLIQAHCLGLIDTVEKDIHCLVGRQVKDWRQCYPHPELVQKVLEAVVDGKDGKGKQPRPRIRLSRPPEPLCYGSPEPGDIFGTNSSYDSDFSE
eukprot:Skav220884  [mRNA]  locus=scaffold1977:22842:39863:- [translate_table: standard]